MAVDDFTARSHDDGVRDRASHVLVQDGGEVIAAASEEVAVGRAVFGLEGVFNFLAEASRVLKEERFGFRFVFRLIEADRDELEITHVELAGDFNEVREFLDAWGAPGGPDVDHAVFVGGIGAQFGDARLVDEFDGHRGLSPGFVFSIVHDLLFAPLGGAAHGLGEFEGDGLARQDRVHGILAILRLHGAVIVEAGVVEASLVAELEVLIEDEDVRGGEAAISARDGLLVAVIEVIKGPLVLLSVGLHFLVGVAELTVAELIFAEAIRVVGIDGDELHALGLIFFIEALKAALDAMGGRAMVRGKEDHEGFATGVLSEFVHLSIGADEREVGRRIPALEGVHIGRVAVDEAREVGRTDAGDGGQDGKERQESLHEGKGYG